MGFFSKIAWFRLTRFFDPFFLDPFFLTRFFCHNLTRGAISEVAAVLQPSPRQFSFSMARDTLNSFLPLFSAAGSEEERQQIGRQMLRVFRQSMLPRRRKWRPSTPREIWRSSPLSRSERLRYPAGNFSAVRSSYFRRVLRARCALTNQLLQDLRFGLRTLKNSPGFTAVAVVTLALGIGGQRRRFSFVDGILLKPLPYGEPDRILRVLEKPPGGGRNSISALNYLDWQKQNTVFEYMAAQTGGSVTLSGVSEPVQLRGARVSPHYFDIFGIKPVLGRTFAPDEDQLGKGDVAVLSHRLWETQFGADRGILGRKIVLDGRPSIVIGVLPAGGAFDRAYSQIWRPLVFEPQNLTRNFHWLGSYALLKRGVTLEQARAGMDSIGAQIAQQFPDSNKGWGVNVERYTDVIVGPDLRRPVRAHYDGRRRNGAVDRVREPRQPHDGARFHPRAGGGRAGFARRGPLAAGPAGIGGKRPIGGLRRRGGTGRGIRGDGGLARGHPSVQFASGSECRDGRAHSAFQPGDFGGHWRVVRSGSRDP